MRIIALVLGFQSYKLFPIDISYLLWLVGGTNQISAFES
uniref:Uncharacterized protein n=1 Tax=Arundo donax TaxID=35708 RepID=A0A0A9AZS5_ARUDO